MDDMVFVWVVFFVIVSIFGGALSIRLAVAEEKIKDLESLVQKMQMENIYVKSLLDYYLKTKRQESDDGK